MTQSKRGRLSATQKAELWCRWKAGQSLHEIGRALGKDHVVVHFLLARHGGIAPAARRRALLTLTLAEREGISRGIACGSSIRDIAKGLDRAASTVSREVARHGGRPQYRASEADRQAWELAWRPKACLLAIHEKLRTIVASKLILDWSPEQNFRMAEDPVSPGREPARVPRDHLPQPVPAGARSAEERAD
jgi:Helix-turn-helix domain